MSEAYKYLSGLFWSYTIIQSLRIYKVKLPKKTEQQNKHGVWNYQMQDKKKKKEKGEQRELNTYECKAKWNRMNKLFQCAES